MKEILIKMGITFVEATVGFIVATAATGINITDKQEITLMIAGAVGMGISAVWNTIIVPLIEKLKKKYQIK